MENLILVLTGLALLTAFYGLYVCGKATIKVNNLEKKYEQGLYDAFEHTIETFQLSPEFKQKLNKAFSR